MTNTFSKFSICTMILATSTSILANGYNLQSTTSYAKQGFIVGVDGGVDALLAPDIQYLSSEKEDGGTHKPWGWGTHVGYDFQITPDLLIGPELGYKNFNQSKHFKMLYIKYDESYKQNALDLLIGTHYYVYQGFNIFGKLGAAYVTSNTIDLTCSYSNNKNNMVTYIQPKHGHAHKIEPEFVLGIGYTFLEHIDTHLAFTYIGGDSHQIKVRYNDNYLSKARIYASGALMLGVSYKF
jgi:hypothetical protein